MKVVILAGGLGTRLSEETILKPKPMVEVGGKPILWHIMKIYSAFGFNDFVVCLGYKGYLIKEYFFNYYYHNSDISISLSSNDVQVHNSYSEPWNITLVDTGDNTLTGGRIKRVRKHIDSSRFMLTYGDGVGNVNIPELLSFHQAKGRLCTVTAVQPSGRFGALNLQADDTVNSFLEKPRGDGSWINGGFFVCEPEVLEYIDDDQTTWEREPMERLAAAGQMTAYKHQGYWKPMDTLRDKHELEAEWLTGHAKWKTW